MRIRVLDEQVNNPVEESGSEVIVDNGPLEAEYVPKKRFDPKLGEIAIDGADRGLEEAVDEDFLPVASLRCNNLKLGVDINTGKLLAITLLFMLMFVLPVAINEGAFDLNNFRRQEVYTTTAINAAGQSNNVNKTANNGSVAGASDQAVASNNQASDGVTVRQFLGMPVAILMVLIGILLVSFPMLAILNL